MNDTVDFKKLLSETDLSDGRSIERYAFHLRGKTFQEILDLGIHPKGYTEKNYKDKRFKGGMGELIEERYFGYKANSDDRPDFPDAGVELKATCYDVLAKDGRLSAGERLVLTMIPYDRAVSDDFYESHLWKKCRLILLVIYERNRDIEKTQQGIKFVKLFSIPERDLDIIEDDYKKIVSYIKSGRADELSEGMTTYLGACTKGSTAAKSWVDQYYPYIDESGNAVHRKAKKRAFCLKRQYMDYALHNYFLKADGGFKSDSIVAEQTAQTKPFDEIVTDLISRYIGKSDKEIFAALDVKYNRNKSTWTTLTYRMLGVKGNQAEEFQKGGISIRVVRIKPTGTPEEDLSFSNFKFLDLIREKSWDDSELRDYLDKTRFFFVIFRQEKDCCRLTGSFFWNMPVRDIDGGAQACWTATRETIISGVKLEKSISDSGRISIKNDLPKSSENPVMHVRPKAKKSAYLLADGTRIGDIEKDADELPGHLFMTRQCFWINKKYLKQVIQENLPRTH